MQRVPALTRRPRDGLQCHCGSLGWRAGALPLPPPPPLPALPPASTHTLPSAPPPSPPSPPPLVPRPALQRGTYGLTAEEKMRRRWSEWSKAGSSDATYEVRGCRFCGRQFFCGVASFCGGTGFVGAPICGAVGGLCLAGTRQHAAWLCCPPNSYLASPPPPPPPPPGAQDLVSSYSALCAANGAAAGAASDVDVRQLVQDPSILQVRAGSCLFCGQAEGGAQGQQTSLWRLGAADGAEAQA